MIGIYNINIFRQCNNFEIVVKRIIEVFIYFRDIKYGQSTCSIFHEVQLKRVAMLDELTTLEYDIKRMCPPSGPKIESQLRVTRHSVRQTGHAWAIRAGTPFKPALDYYLGIFLSGKEVLMLKYHQHF